MTYYLIWTSVSIWFILRGYRFEEDDAPKHFTEWLWVLNLVSLILWGFLSMLVTIKVTVDYFA